MATNRKETRKGKMISKAEAGNEPAKHAILFINVTDEDTGEKLNIKRYFRNQEEKAEFMESMKKGSK
ncbi:hypothetical protein CHI12_16660 [Terribacillus saccharophilus]|uniref:Uncharacterized protein n=1 Tax=Terribacillus saccharophilus TaxID=361277 RepID=A0A268H945_9BACI|nr:hypothetical protein [Terribacillus saccharophilus]PAE06406.1 hypothetical protein CHI12_16660 [Terribacillus saccharophilus]